MQTKYNLAVFPKAVEDIENIVSYVANELKNNSAATKLLNDFYNIMESIRSFPTSCPKINNIAVKNNNLRKAIVKNYIVFYHVNELSHTIEIVRVLYGMMNYIDIL